MLRKVKTENGYVKGVPAADPRITAFKGIPFAAPPIGENRWRAPQPAKDWDGVLEAYAFAPISVQDTPGLGTDIYCKEWHVDPEIAMDEDCLYLNVWTPAKKADEKLPVLIWYFGGALQWGYPSEMEFDGERLARRGIIVVSVNYRLGAIGFMAHPELTKEQPDAPTNFGNLDQQFGLEWVIRNIEAFGGDPNNITISGQSAGGGSVLSLITCKKNFGRISKAVIFSGIIRSPYGEADFIIPESLEKAEKTGSMFLEKLGVSSIEEARKLDATFIRNSYAEFRGQGMGTSNWFATCIDGQFLVDEPYKMLMNGDYCKIPILAGNTSDEFMLALQAGSDEEFENKCDEIFGKKSAKEFLSFDEAKKKSGSNGYVPVSNIETAVKAAFIQNEINGNGRNCYYYKFDADIPGDDKPGTFHSVDLWFWFETLAKCWRPFIGRHYDLARQMCNYWVNFVKTGDPNGKDADGRQMPEWKPYGDKAYHEMVFGKDGAGLYTGESDFNKFLIKAIANRYKKRQAFNPCLPSWEYIPDGEPYVFGDRVYVYGSHDYYNGAVFCLGDYVCWSAPVDDLADWRYEGVIYDRTADPLNINDNMCLYAPDVTVGPDGRYYLYYALDKEPVISVAVCDKPAGKYEFYGYVHYQDGTVLGRKEGDEPQFDPGVLTEGDVTYLFSGFCGIGDKSRTGSKVCKLDKDMLTILEGPSVAIPGIEYSKGTGFEEHAFFEASSIRKRGDKYYLVYSSHVMHELCYAISDQPDKGFVFGGVIVSNCDMHIDTYKPADMPTAYGANNHGSIVEIGDEWYIFYHRQTLNSWYSRQGCIEKIKFEEDGSIKQVEITSCGANGGPLRDTDCYPTYIACNMFTDTPSMYVGVPDVPFIKQDGKDGDEFNGYIDNILDSATMGFKYFDCKNVKGVRLTARGYAGGNFEIRTSIDGDLLGSVKIDFTNVWTSYDCMANIPDGVNALYIKYVGGGKCSLKSFEFIH